MKKLNEFDLIKTYFAPLAGEGSFDLQDDAALLTVTPGHVPVITQDALAEGVHFFADDPPDLIAKKALRVNLSDLAAKGAKPKSISLALGLGTECNEAWVEQFASGLREDCVPRGISLSGGDTFKTGTGTVISITAIGEVPQGQYVSRLGANAGDEIFVTGTIGDGALGLLARQGMIKSEYLKMRYLLPQPKIGFTNFVRKYASASMDVSDGLVGDLEKLCCASNVGAEIIANQIPFSKDAKRAIDDESKYLKTALTGGDDYEILLTVPSNRVSEFTDEVSKQDFTVTAIGRIIAGEGAKVFDNSGKAIEFDQTSYTHTGG